MAKNYDLLEMTTPLMPDQTLPLEKIPHFEKLARLTHGGINSELEACSNEIDYSQIVAPWIAVKCYYRLYYLESVLVYLMNGNKTGFSHGGHAGVRKAIRNLINSNELIFSNPEISIQSSISMIRSHTITSGANLSPTYYLTPECIHSVRKKVSDYVEHHWKDSNRIRNYSTRVNRTLRDDYFSTTTLNLTDFFYWMRIKANYKDVDFLDFENDITSNDAYQYIIQFSVAHESYAHALEVLILQLKSLRGMST